MNYKLQIKPLSVNQAWQGKRFKTNDYKAYEKLMLLSLPPLKKTDKIPDMIRIEFQFGFSNINADIDNPVKPLLDILQKKYKFNDSQVWEMEVGKKKVAKGQEYIQFNIMSVLPFE